MVRAGANWRTPASSDILTEPRNLDSFPSLWDKVCIKQDTSAGWSRLTGCHLVPNSYAGSQDFWTLVQSYLFSGSDDLVKEHEAIYWEAWNETGPSIPCNWPPDDLRPTIK